MENQNNKTSNENRDYFVEPLASEMYKDLQKHDKFKGRVIIALVIALCLAICGNIAQGIYHVYMWSQFETVVVDSGENGGPANYVGGDNTGGIYNGEGSSTPTEEGQGR